MRNLNNCSKNEGMTCISEMLISTGIEFLNELSELLFFIRDKYVWNPFGDSDD
jgi:hypothetical protein